VHQPGHQLLPACAREGRLPTCPAVLELQVRGNLGQGVLMYVLEKINDSGHLSLCHEERFGDSELNRSSSSIIRNTKEIVYKLGSLTPC
jgi:hypothetical protein